MRSILYLVAIVLPLLLINSCSETVDPSPLGPWQLLDTLSRYVTPGIVIRLDSLRDLYASHEHFQGRLILINISDVNALPIYTPNYPPFEWNVRNLDSNDYVASNTEFLSFEYVDTLAIGDTTMFSLAWGQVYTVSDSLLHDLYVPLGRYLYTVSMKGNSKFRPLTKYFEIR